MTPVNALLSERIPNLEKTMDTSTKKSMHPLITIAAISVTLFSLAGIAAITGLIPTSHSQSAQMQSAKALDEPVAAAKTDSAPQTSAATTAPSPAEKPFPRRAAAKPARPIAQAATPAPEKASNDSAPVTLAQNAPAVLPPPAATIPPPPPPPAVEPKPLCRDCGVIESVRQIEKKGDGSGAGAVVGGLLGGVLGHQTGRGHGRDAMTVLGAIGGAVAGHQVEKNANKAVNYQITIRFEDGSSRLITQNEPPAWRQGDRVKLVDGIISANNTY